MTEESKKDLTNLLETMGIPLAPENPEGLPEGLTEGPVETAAPGVLDQAPPPSTVAEFETLEELQKSAPALDLPGMPATPGVETAPPVETAAPPEFVPTPEPAAPEPAPLPPQAPLTPDAAVSSIRAYAEQTAPGRLSVLAAFPFSVLIEGALSTGEREKLLDILSREKMDIREVDLEPQFAAGRVLIPRVSEYAGVLIVQALRGAQARLRFGPSDTIFATEDTREERGEAQGPHARGTLGQASQHPAESLPVTPAAQLPDGLPVIVIDVVTASATLKTRMVEAESSSEYQELLEALQREVKYKAYRKGASAVLNFSVQLNRLGSPESYRLTVLGSAVRGSNAS